MLDDVGCVGDVGWSGVLVGCWCGVQVVAWRGGEVQVLKVKDAFMFTNGKDV